MIRIAQLTKRFGKVDAIQNLSLDLEAGRAYGVVGPNGSGKTTLFRILTGLLSFDRGEVEVLGKSPRAVDHTMVGYMPQVESLYGDLTALENIRFFAQIAGLSGETMEERVQEVVSLMRLEEHTSKLVEELSGGLARRTSLACAVVHRPRLLFLDEPTVGVDPKLRLAFWEEFARLKAGGATLLVSTHHLDEATRCDELILLRSGKLLARGAPATLLEHTGRSTIEEAFMALAEQAE